MPEMEPARSRREEYAEATYEALLDSAAGCFVETGYLATSLDQVAQRARVTKGAIYHHFASKRDLFVAVVTRQLEQNAGQVTRAGEGVPDVWGGIVAAFDTFLQTLSDPVYQRLCFMEGPAALGFEDWWAIGETYEIAVIRGLLDRAAEAGVLLVADVDMLAHAIFGAVTAGVLSMARSAEPDAELERFRGVMLAMMAGMLEPGTAPKLGLS